MFGGKIVAKSFLTIGFIDGADFNTSSVVKLHVLFVLEILRVVHLRNLNLNELRKSQFNEDVA